MPIVSAAGDVWGASIGSSAQKDASKAMAKAQKYSTDMIYKMFEESNQLQEPFRQAGMWALERLVGTAGMGPYMGGGPTTEQYVIEPGHYKEESQGGHPVKGPVSAGKTQQVWVPPVYGTRAVSGPSAPARPAVPGLLEQGPPTFDFSAYQESPWYQLPLQEGNRFLEQSAAARGNLLSGGTLMAGTKYNQDYAYSKYMPARSQEFYEWVTGKLNPLQSMAGMGQTAATNMAQGAQTAGQDLASTGLYGGAAKASGYLGQANALQYGLQGGSNALQTAYGAGAFNFLKPQAVGAGQHHLGMVDGGLMSIPNW